jgi:hypothetical protein
MNTKLSIPFFVKRTKTNVNGLLPIFIRVTVNGELIEFTTKRFTTSEKWSVEGNRMKSTSVESKSINSYLDALKAKVYDYQQQLIREERTRQCRKHAEQDHEQDKSEPINGKFYQKNQERIVVAKKSLSLYQ